MMKTPARPGLRAFPQRLHGGEWSDGTLVLLSAAALGLFYNQTFWKQVFIAYPPVTGNLPFLGSLAFCLFGMTALVLLLLDFPYVLKPWLVLVFMSASIAAYFMDTYQVVIDHSMLQNAFLTDAKEVRDLLSLKLFLSVLFLGVLPSGLILKVKIRYPDSIKRYLWSRFKNFGSIIIIIVILLFSFSKNYASFLREHKPVRSFANPDFLVYSLAKFASTNFSTARGPVTPLGEDAKVLDPAKGRALIIMVVGESARADHFSLNGYSRDTNPLLRRQNVVTFTNVHSWGTSTANAVPCMFSTLNQKTYSENKIRSSENLLDVLRHAKVNVLWRDNNSDSRKIAARVPYEDFKSKTPSPASEGETRDVDMLAGLQDTIDRTPGGDLFIVLHQMGNHGPAYYKRYPAAFERFTPVQKTNELGKCSPEEIANAYDNAILYTDYFLSRVIDLLKANENKFQTAMLYSSDHGESLGEQGIYLHGLPYFIAPEAQKHVATVFWFSDNFQINRKELQQKSTQAWTHTNLFHTVLGLLRIQTKVYDPALDLSQAGPTPPPQGP